MSDTLSQTTSGHCYCGATAIACDGAPLIVSYCHCSDCRRISGAPVAAFAAFAEANVILTSDVVRSVSIHQGVTRRFCGVCGSPVAAVFDYLPGQTYIPVGILDDVESLAPQLHSHAESAVKWLCLADELPREGASARNRLMSEGET